MHGCSLSQTHIAQACVYNAVHLGNTPLHYVAEALVVDIKVLPPHGTLCPFFEFVLTVAIPNGSGPSANSGQKEENAHACIKPSFSKVAMSLLSSLTCSPTLPAKSSSLRLGDRDKQLQEGGAHAMKEHSHLVAC